MSYLGAYWGARAEPVEACAERAAALLRVLPDIDPLLIGWRNTGESLQDALAQPLVTTDRADLVSRLLDGRNRRDVGGEVIEELGYSVSWWNGSDDGEISLAVSLAKTAVAPNCVVIELSDSHQSPRLYEAQTARRLMCQVISIFRPDHALWTSHALRRAQEDVARQAGRPRRAADGLVRHSAGWATYLADTYRTAFEPADLPAIATVERLDGGTLVTLGDDPANPPVDSVIAVRRCMM